MISESRPNPGRISESPVDSRMQDAILDLLMCAAAGFGLGILLAMWVVAW